MVYSIKKENSHTKTDEFSNILTSWKQRPNKKQSDRGG